MNELMNGLLKGKAIRWVVLVVVLAVGYYAYANKNNNIVYTIIGPEVKNLRQNIKIAGVVKPAEAVDLGFEVSGRIEKVNVKAGQAVKQGQELIVIDNKDARARVAQAYAQVSNASAVYRQAQAQLVLEQSKLDELKRGPRTEAVDLSQSKLSAAKQSLTDAQRNLQIAKERASSDILSLLDSAQSRLQEAYVDADAAINQYCDGIFNNSQSSNPSLSFSTSNQQDKIQAENLRGQMKVELDALQQLSLKNITNNESGADAALADANARLLKIVSFLDAVKSTLSGSFSLTSSELNNYKTAVNVARGNVLNRSNSITQALNNLKTQRLANSNLISAGETAVATAQNNVTIAGRELNVVLSGSSKEEIFGQETVVKQKKINIDGMKASVGSAEAGLLEAQANLDKTILKSPFDGKITKLDATTGQLVSGGTSLDKKSLISIISNAGLQIEVNIPEIDIAKITSGNKVSVNVDAYGETVTFDGTVTTIESGETIINGVPTYKTIIQFTKQDERLKPGMTANLDITTAEIDNVLALPLKTIIFEKGDNYVDVASGDDNKVITRKKIEIGLKSSDGYVEIKSGLNPDDKIVLQQ